MPPLSTFHSPDSRSLALADSWKHSDFPAGTVKPKDAARPTRQPRRSRHLRDITPGLVRGGPLDGTHRAELAPLAEFALQKLRAGHPTRA